MLYIHVVFMYLLFISEINDWIEILVAFENSLLLVPASLQKKKYLYMCINDGTWFI